MLESSSMFPSVQTPMTGINSGDTYECTISLLALFALFLVFMFGLWRKSQQRASHLVKAISAFIADEHGAPGS